jgi:hypothetical protein
MSRSRIPNGDKIDYEWIMLESEIGLTGTGGDAEVVPDEINIKVMEETGWRADRSKRPSKREATACLSMPATAKAK